MSTLLDESGASLLDEGGSFLLDEGVTSMTGTLFADLQDAKRQLIRKTLQGLVATAPLSAAAITGDTFADAAGLLALPAGYEQLGVVDDNGAQFSRSVDTSTVTSWGDVEPSRQDIKTDTTTLVVACNETRAASMGLYLGVDMSGVEATHLTGVVSIDKPQVTQLPQRRVLVIGVDTIDAGEIYIGRHLLSAKITAYNDMQLNSSADAASPMWGVTFTAFKDDTAGVSERWLFGGIGWRALLADMGITEASS